MAVVINGTTGITDVNGSAAAPAITGTDTDTGIFFGTNTVSVSTNGTERLQIDASGNLGLGVTPSAWVSGDTVLQIKAGSGSSALWGRNNSLRVVGNAYFDGTNYKYIASDYASFMICNPGSVGGFNWNIAPSGTAGTTASFTQAMTLDASGNWLLGTTSVGTMSGSAVARLSNTGIIARTNNNLASGSAINIVVSSGGASFAGFLVVENVLLSNALARTQTTYSVFGRGTTFTATSIASANGSSGGASFTVTCPSTGVISVTNTSGNPTFANMSFFGSEGG
jgi:hypothetical protein